MSTTLIRLSKARKKIIQEVREDMLRVYHSTEPADFDAAEAAFTRLYERAGIEKPLFIRMPSIKAAVDYIDAIGPSSLYEDYGHGPWDQLMVTSYDPRLVRTLQKLRKHHPSETLSGDFAIYGGYQGAFWNLLDEVFTFPRVEESIFYPEYSTSEREGRPSSWCRGQWDARFLGKRLSLKKMGVSFEEGEKESGDDWETVIRSCGVVFPTSTYCVLVDRPEILKVQNRVLHCENGPALKYRDGQTFHFLDGLPVPAVLVEAPESITIEDISTQRHAHIRRWMIDKYKDGPSSWLADTKAIAIDRDPQFGILWRGKPVSSNRDAKVSLPTTVLQVKNSTPALDGLFKDYWLWVPPEMQSAREAVAWTFGLKGEEYEPIIET